MAITLTFTYDKIRKVLSLMTGRLQEKILSTNKLVDDFGFTEVGFIRLFGELQTEFNIYQIAITQEDVSGSETVEDLVQAVWAAIPDSHKETTPFTDTLLSHLELFQAFSHEMSKTSEARRKERAFKKRKA